MFGENYEKNRFRMMLKRLREDDQLDRLIERFIYFIKKHEIYLGPSKGRAGEDGKDVVAIEDQTKLFYCSYVIKAGHLNRKNLEGPCGIVRQMRQAMSIELKDRRYHGKKRTAIIVHNGKVTNNSYHNRFIMEKEKLEDEMRDKLLLLRSIERWDLNKITDEIFPFAHELECFEMQELIAEKQGEQEYLSKKFVEEMENLADPSDVENMANIARKYHKKIKEMESNYPIVFPKING